MKHDATSRIFISAFLLCTLSACDWVDSAGDGSPGTLPATDIFLDDDQVGTTIEIEEKKQVRLSLSSEGRAGVQYNFSWDDEPLEQGNLSSCQLLDNFPSEVAVASLNDACSDPDECSLSFDPIEGDSQDDDDTPPADEEEPVSEDDNGVAAFSMLIPRLRAPVGLRFELTTSGSDGTSYSTDYDFCLISINDPPIPGADTFAVQEGRILQVGADERNLLSNDSDDEDLSNTDFKILTQAAEEPRNAASFSLGEDGSFTYEPDFTGLQEDQLDGFKYTLTDGVHEVEGSVSIRVTAANLAPIQVNDIPLFSLTENESLSEDLAPYFTDPENVSLSFSFSADSVLPPSGGFSLTTDGVLSGTAAVGDAGSYTAIIVVSDGQLSTSGLLMLEIALAPLPAPNEPPRFVDGAVLNRFLFLGNTLFPIRPQFIDPDGDILTYRASRRLPAGLSINSATGVITGVPQSRFWAQRLTVIATDPSGATARSKEFSIRVF